MTPFQKLARLAFSAERAAAYAYQGHARSVKDPVEKLELAQIESEEWFHRESLRRILTKIGGKPSPFLEIKYALIGRGIGLSCHFIGWFMPMYFAGRLESGNVIEYVHMEILAREYGLEEEIECIREMAKVEKTHEMYFLEKARTKSVLRIFQWMFRWGQDRSFNDLRPIPFQLRARAEAAAKVAD